MKRSSLIVLVVAAMAVSGLIAATETPKTDAFEKIKALAGVWEGTGHDGKPVKVSYTVISAGSAVMEQLEPGEEHDMVTMYNKDGARLMMTHYCASGNQPRMRAANALADGNKISFSFVDATNLAKPTDGHMVKLVMTFPDPDHLTEEWTYRTNGKDDTMVFNFARKQ